MTGSQFSREVLNGRAEVGQQPMLRSSAAAARCLKRRSVLLALELEAGVERGLGDLELLGARLGGREPVLELVTRDTRARARAGGRDVAASSRRSRSRPRPRRATPRAGPPAACSRGRARGEQVREGRGREQRARRDGRRSARAPWRRRRVLLVGADRDVLGAVVGGERAAAQRQDRRSDARGCPRRAPRAVSPSLERRTAWIATAVPTIEARARAALERQLRLGQRPLEPRQDRERTRRAAPGRAGAAGRRASR